MRIGDSLRYQRIAADFTQSDFADIVGISRAVYNRIEMNRYFPSWETLVRIAKVLGITVSELVKDVG